MVSDHGGPMIKLFDLKYFWTYCKGWGQSICIVQPWLWFETSVMGESYTWR